MKELTIDGITYYEPEERMTYDEAVEWAKTRGLRLLTRGEWCDLWDYKEEFRESCRAEYYWTNMAAYRLGYLAWYFCTIGEKFNYNYRDNSYAVRAVKTDMK